MFHSDLVRQTLLAGYSLQAPNGYSELFAVYVGVWLATAAIAGCAAFSVQEHMLGDAVGWLVVSQPVGRLLAIPR